MIVVGLTVCRIYVFILRDLTLCVFQKMLENNSWRQDSSPARERPRDAEARTTIIYGRTHGSRYSKSFKNIKHVLAAAEYGSQKSAKLFARERNRTRERQKQ